MYSTQITAEMAAAHHRDLVAAAEAGRLARQVRRTGPEPTATRRVRRRPWVRSTIRPAHA